MCISLNVHTTTALKNSDGKVAWKYMKESMLLINHTNVTNYYAPKVSPLFQI